MLTLVEDVVKLENEAESIIAHAHAEAEQLGKTYEEEIVAYHKKTTEGMNEKIAEFQKNIEETHKAALYEAERELKESLDALDHIPEDVLYAQVERIVVRLINNI